MSNKYRFRIRNREPIICANTRIVIPEVCYEKSVRQDRNIIGKHTECSQRLHGSGLLNVGPVIKSYSKYHESPCENPMVSSMLSVINKDAKYRMYNPSRYKSQAQPIVSEFMLFSTSVCINNG